MDAGDHKLEVNPVWGEFGISAPIRVATVPTSHAEMAKDEPTDDWFEEIANLYYAFVDGDAQVEILSIAPNSLSLDTGSSQHDAAAAFGSVLDRRDDPMHRDCIFEARRHTGVLA
jgi:hypothetical protein